LRAKILEFTNINFEQSLALCCPKILTGLTLIDQTFMGPEQISTKWRSRKI